MAACSSLQYSLHAGMLIQLHLQEFVINTKHSPLPLASGLATSGGSGDPDSQALSASQKLWLPTPRNHHGSPCREPAHAKMKFHFFYFHIKVTGIQSFA